MLATVDDLGAIGAIRPNEASDDLMVERAHRLLEMASAQVVAYLRYASEDALLAVLTDPQRKALAAVVAEAAGQRLNVSAAPSSDFGEGAGWASALLNRRHWRAIDQLMAVTGRGSMSIELTRDTSSSYVGSWYAEDA